MESYLAHVAPLMRQSGERIPTIAVDGTDIIKPCAARMPFLASVRDGSKGTLGLGYDIVSIEAVGERGRRLPLASRLYSARHPGYQSQTRETIHAIDSVRHHVPQEAVWVFDRGYDGRRFRDELNRRALRYAVRLRLKDRFVFVDGNRQRMKDLVEATPATGRFRIRRISKSTTLQVSWVSAIRLQEYRNSGRPRGEGTLDYSLVIVRGTGREPIVILTNMAVNSKSEAIEVANAYMDRWGVEEAHRLVKQSFDLENLRALTWRGLERLVFLAMLAYGYLATLVHSARNSTEKIVAKHKAFGDVPTYMYYRLVEVVSAFLVRAGPRVLR